MDDCWSRPVDELIAALSSSREGLQPAAAAERLQRHGPNLLVEERRKARALRLFLDRFRSPLVLILVFAATVALFVHDWPEALIVLCIVFVTAVLSFAQEHRASAAVESLRRRVTVRSTVLRGGREMPIPADQVVPGDLVKLAAGTLIPGDGVLVDARDFFASQALLTGETFPAEKRPAVLARELGLTERSNCVYMGTSVRSGTATALVVQTGRATAYGRIAETLALRAPETEFERGLRRFGAMLVRVMVIIVLAVLAINIVLGHPTVETLMFALALAVGLSPELLPAILTITLARGARNMAARGVIVKRLNAIENLGSMDVFCTDKTGTLTRGVVRLDSALDADGRPSDEVMRLAFVNSRLQTGLANPLDEAVVAAGEAAGNDVSGVRKLDEVPYDFARKRLSVLVRQGDDARATLITKGALQNELDVCDRRAADGADGCCRREDEKGLVFEGFLLFFDPPEDGVRQTLEGLRQLGVRLTIVTGDNRFVARHVAEAVGIEVERVVTGAELTAMKDEALWHIAPRVALFAEVDPNQKERVIRALQKTGHVVGYLGDGINDAPALQAADVGISVDQAVDVAKDAADFVMLEHDLEVLRRGIEEGRHTFANTLKYIFITTSANFGNMVSMALASLFLPFLPLLAKQVLLNNFLSDLPTMGIAGDSDDRDWQRTPHRWDIRLVRNFMLTFGLLSTVFDLLTFALLLYLAGEAVETFRTGWFVESLLTELLILFVIRTYLPFYRSRAGRFLAWSSALVVAFALALPYLPIAALFGFVALPSPILIAILSVTAAYLVVSELTKRAFFSRSGLRDR